MKKTAVTDALAALAQENRLDAFRLLIQAGPEGLAAGEVAAALGLPPNTLSFHLDRLRQAGLVTVRRQGRSMIYAARYDTMNALLRHLAESLFEYAISRTYAGSVVSGLSLEQALACKTGCPLLARSLWARLRQPRRQSFFGQAIGIPHSNRL